MHHRFGKQTVQSMLVSEKETFWNAMKDSFQMDIEEFFEQYQQWVEDWESP